jgi:hypothetical protein
MVPRLLSSTLRGAVTARTLRLNTKEQPNDSKDSPKSLLSIAMKIRIKAFAHKWVLKAILP